MIDGDSNINNGINDWEGANVIGGDNNINNGTNDW